jgi:hypothetical protein
MVVSLFVKSVYNSQCISPERTCGVTDGHGFAAGLDVETVSVSVGDEPPKDGSVETPSAIVEAVPT